jgi:hypothetical protein
MARLYAVPDQPPPDIDPAEEIHDVRIRVEALRLNPMLSLSSVHAAESFADLLEMYDRFGAP